MNYERLARSNASPATNCVARHGVRSLPPVANRNLWVSVDLDQMAAGPIQAALLERSMAAIM